VLVGPETSDDAGVYLLHGTALVATADFITPVCDDARQFGRVAAANALSDVYAMGGRPLFALNLCCFPDDLPDGVAGDMLAGIGDALREAGAALLGGHSVADPELKLGLAVIGEADPDRLLRNDGALVGDRLLLSKPLGTGVLVNAFKADRLDAGGLAPALAEMARLNAEAARLALAHGARAATDVTGFGLAGHAWNIARQSRVTLRFELDRLPVYAGFREMVAAGVTTGCTTKNRDHVSAMLNSHRRLSDADRELLFDPQTSGGLLIATPAEAAAKLLEALLASGHQAALVGDVTPGPARLEIV
jgi:selenide,water dikinase